MRQSLIKTTDRANYIFLQKTKANQHIYSTAASTLKMFVKLPVSLVAKRLLWHQQILSTIVVEKGLQKRKKRNLSRVWKLYRQWGALRLNTFKFFFKRRWHRSVLTGGPFLRYLFSDCNKRYLSVVSHTSFQQQPRLNCLTWKRFVKERKKWREYKYIRDFRLFYWYFRKTNNNYFVSVTDQKFNVILWDNSFTGGKYLGKSASGKLALEKLLLRLTWRFRTKIKSLFWSLAIKNLPSAPHNYSHIFKIWVIFMFQSLLRPFKSMFQRFIKEGLKPLKGMLKIKGFVFNDRIPFNGCYSKVRRRKKNKRRGHYRRRFGRAKPLRIKEAFKKPFRFLSGEKWANMAPQTAIKSEISKLIRLKTVDPDRRRLLRKKLRKKIKWKKKKQLRLAKNKKKKHV